MEVLEGLFKKINKLKIYVHFSMDLYFNDLDGTFVVKLSNIISDKRYPNIHFRNHKIIDSMLDAYNHLLSISGCQIE